LSGTGRIDFNELAHTENENIEIEDEDNEVDSQSMTA